MNFLFSRLSATPLAFGLFLLACAGCQKTESPRVDAIDRALFQAIVDGSLDRVQWAVENGANIQVWVGEGTNRVNPLLAATAFDRPQIVNYLARQGAGSDESFQGYRVSDLARHLWDADNATYKLLLQKEYLR